MCCLGRLIKSWLSCGVSPFNFNNSKINYWEWTALPLSRFISSIKRKTARGSPHHFVYFPEINHGCAYPLVLRTTGRGSPPPHLSLFSFQNLTTGMGIPHEIRPATSPLRGGVFTPPIKFVCLAQERDFNEDQRHHESIQTRRPFGIRGISVLFCVFFHLICWCSFPVSGSLPSWVFTALMPYCLHVWHEFPIQPSV